MKFRKRVLSLAFAACLLLAGCGKDSEAPTNPSDASNVPSPSGDASVSTDPSGSPATNPVTTTPLTQGYPSPLTGELLAVKMDSRPIAVTLNNIVDAMPQYGVGSADILYEVLAEGGITRCLGIYHDVSTVDTLGSIRSARPCLLDIAMAYDAVYVHAGGSSDAYNELSSTDWDHIDGVRGSNASSYYYRDQDRLSQGYALEHTLFIHGKDVVTYALERGCEMTRTQVEDYGLHFAQDGTPSGGTQAQKVTVEFANSSKTTDFVYNSSTGLYAASQYGGAYIDAATNQQLQFRNIIMITASTSYDSDGYRVYVELTDSGDGYYACGGKMIPIHWSRSGDTAPFVYTLADGSPLTLGVGKTYIAVTPYGSEMQCS